MELSWPGQVLEASYWTDYYWKMAEDENKEFMELLGKVPDSESGTEAVRAGAAILQPPMKIGEVYAPVMASKEDTSRPIGSVGNQEQVTESLRSKDIIQAIARGREGEVEARLRQGVEHVNSVFLVKKKPRMRPLLHCAVAYKKTRIVELLLRYKADITIVDSFGFTCLHWNTQDQGPQSRRILDMLLAAGAELNPLNNFGTTPLEEAILSDNLHAAETLIRAGAPVPCGAREMAERKCKTEFIELFQQIPSSGPRSQPEVVGAARLPPPSPLITFTEEKEPLLNRDSDDAESDELRLDRSPIQHVFCMAKWRNLRVTYKVEKAEQQHMPLFLAQCIVGHLVTEGEGFWDGQSKRRAARLMVDRLKQLPRVSKPRRAVIIMKQKMKKMSRNLIKSILMIRNLMPQNLMLRSLGESFNTTTKNVNHNFLVIAPYIASIRSLFLSIRGFPSFSSWSGSSSNRGGYFDHDSSLRMAHDGMTEDGMSDVGTVFLASVIREDQIVDVE